MPLEPRFDYLTLITFKDKIYQISKIKEHDFVRKALDNAKAKNINEAGAEVVQQANLHGVLGAIGISGKLKGKVLEHSVKKFLQTLQS